MMKNKKNTSRGMKSGSIMLNTVITDEFEQRGPVSSTVITDESEFTEGVKMAEHLPPEILVFPPFPLATGTVLLSPEGVRREVKAITLVITTNDSEETHVVLQSHHDAWWAPVM